MQAFIAKYWKAIAAAVSGIVGQAIAQGLLTGNSAKWAALILAAVFVPGTVALTKANVT